MKHDTTLVYHLKRVNSESREVILQILAILETWSYHIRLISQEFLIEAYSGKGHGFKLNKCAE